MGCDCGSVGGLEVLTPSYLDVSIPLPSTAQRFECPLDPMAKG